MHYVLIPQRRESLPSNSYLPELAFLTIDPAIKIVAPWRLPEFFNRFQGRVDLLDYAHASGIPVTSTKAKPYSMDDNFAHCSYESGQLEDPSQPPPDDMWTRTVDPEKAPNKSQDIQVVFEKGIPVKLSVGGKDYTDSVELFAKANEIGKEHGIGRIDIVEVCSSCPATAAPLHVLIKSTEPVHRTQEPWMLRLSGHVCTGIA